MLSPSNGFSENDKFFLAGSNDPPRDHVIIIPNSAGISAFMPMKRLPLKALFSLPISRGQNECFCFIPWRRDKNKYKQVEISFEEIEDRESRIYIYSTHTSIYNRLNIYIQGKQC